MGRMTFAMLARTTRRPVGGNKKDRFWTSSLVRTGKLLP